MIRRQVLDYLLQNLFGKIVYWENWDGLTSWYFVFFPHCCSCKGRRLQAIDAHKPCGLSTGVNHCNSKTVLRCVRKWLHRLKGSGISTETGNEYSRLPAVHIVILARIFFEHITGSECVTSPVYGLSCVSAATGSYENVNRKEEWGVNNESHS